VVGRGGLMNGDVVLVAVSAFLLALTAGCIWFFGEV
jgi:hypothetical protein